MKYLDIHDGMKGGIITNHFAKCDHKGELSSVFSAIYYLNINTYNLTFMLTTVALCVIVYSAAGRAYVYCVSKPGVFLPNT